MNELTRRTALASLAGMAVTAYAAAARPFPNHLLNGGDNRDRKLGFNIQRATLRPAMHGIFSGNQDQRAALLDFVRDAAKERRTIEWGALDISLDVVSPTNGRRGLVIPSGSHWVMHPEMRIRALPNASSHYEILNILDEEDIVIEGNGARLIGERDTHRGAEGEWGFGLSVRGARNVLVENLIAEDCWGDGFYIGSGRRKYSQDILFRNTKAIRARRNGLSLISVRGFLSEDHESAHTFGSAPQWGVDIEPNDPREYLEDVTFNRTRTRNSDGIGFGIYLAALTSSPNPVSISLVDCSDAKSVAGFSVTSARDIGGRIDLIRARSDKAGEAGISIRRKAVSGPFVRVVEPVITDWNRNSVTPAAAASAISIFAPGGDDGSEALGAVDIIAPDIRLTNKNADASAAIFVKDQRHTDPAPLDHIRILDPVDLAGLRVFLSAETAEFRDRHQVSRRLLPDVDMILESANSFVHNIVQVSKTREYTLAGTQPVGTELAFEIAGGRGSGRICVPKGEQLSTAERDHLRAISSSQDGATLRVRKTGADTWTILEQTGSWTIE
ncbi:right-handed parallel beta-helix repeat-containing protein [Pacificimonas flava]|uniref:YclG n=1 Tax=Pacificimonas flava TaxID=1234595 RepID=M2U1I2_9SPHN|nr:right-handed parallel beta-helix repeat-containing protein [Pacificimonas flava]EMD81693.1 YclG [Pacificimonas flava]MBB5281788.1 hypothetical protein [Pacificimonas flava]